jgi:hypothetical protein
MRYPTRASYVGAAAFSAAAFVGAFVLSPSAAEADEGGVSFWLPGLFGSLAAAPGQPGFSFANIYYHTSVSAGGDADTLIDIAKSRLNRRNS